MSDKELLKLAAKAADMTISYFHESGTAVIYRETYRDAYGACGDYTNWNPLTDDGDALRLAVKLCMSVTNTTIRASVLARPDPDFGDWIDTSEPHTDDPVAATRRAIVRAAAALAHKGARR